MKQACSYSNTLRSSPGIVSSAEIKKDGGELVRCMTDNFLDTVESKAKYCGGGENADKH